MNLQAPHDAFQCRPLGTRLKPASCGARHAAGVDSTCKACPIGAAHKRGETPERWPDGRKVERVRLLPLGALDVTRVPGRRSKR